MPRDKNAYRPWLGCPNANYCGSVCQAWSLPLVRTLFCSVELGQITGVMVDLACYPDNYTGSTWKKYMLGYGYAEAVQLQYQWWWGYLEVQWNIPKFGFAEAVPLEFDVKGNLVINHLNRFANFTLAISGYSQDSDGLWWYGDKRSLKQVLQR